MEFYAKRKGDNWTSVPSMPMMHFREVYRYSKAGQMEGKKLWAESGAETDALEASYTFDQEVRMATQTYPSALPGGPFRERCGRRGVHVCVRCNGAAQCDDLECRRHELD